MDLVILVLVLALVGFLVYAITAYIPMAAPFKTVIYVVVVIALVLWLVRRFGGVIPNVL